MGKCFRALVGMLVAWTGMAASPLDPLPNGDRIPDFSTVGYHHGDAAIPRVPVVVTVRAPDDGSDATKLIQQALDSARSPGAVLLKSGTYKLGGTLAATMARSPNGRLAATIFTGSASCGRWMASAYSSTFGLPDGRQRPDCVRISHGKHVALRSLYEK